MPTAFDDILLPRDLPLSCGIVAHAPSLFHGWVLEAIASPYMVGGNVSREDFAVAACLLSRRAAELSGDLAKALEDCKPQVLKMAKAYAGDESAFKRDSAALSAFLADAAKGLRARKKPGDGWRSPLPYCYTLSVILRVEFGMGEREALEYPLKRAIIDYQILRELRGEKSLISPATARLIDEIQRKAEEEKAP